MFIFHTIMNIKNYLMNNIKSLSIGFLCGTILCLSLVWIAYHTPDYRNNRVDMSDIHKAVNNNDFKAFQSAKKGKELTEKVFTQEQFDMLVAMEKAEDSGDCVTRSELLEKLDLEDEFDHRFWDSCETWFAVKQTIQNDDYELFKTASEWTPIADLVTSKEDFDTQVAILAAKNDGDKETAKSLIETLERDYSNKKKDNKRSNDEDDKDQNDKENDRWSRDDISQI